MKKIIKKLLPQNLILFYHYCSSILAAFFYGFPSKKMLVVGATGTKGKTSTVNFICSCLEKAGLNPGLISTAVIKIGKKEFINKFHMTMPGPFVLQKMLSQMEKEGSKCCIVETTSEGIKQYRHKGIYYDILVFTNLTPEHLPSHGMSFEKYKETKGKIFEELANTPRKIINGQKIEKIIIANNDSPHKDYFLSFRADKKITYGLKDGANFIARDIKTSDKGAEFFLDSTNYQLSVLGEFNIVNALPAIIIASLLKVPASQIQEGLKNLKLVPGRMEKIEGGQNFFVLVDYAHEETSMNAVLDTARKIVGPAKKIIVSLGAEGGGRDKTKRPKMGKAAGEKADFVIVSNVDPYDDDPKEILEDIARAAEEAGKIRNENLFVVEDRREGIKKTLTLAGEGDIVLITGKGAEQSMIIGKKTIPWDDRIVVREELKKILGK